MSAKLAKINLLSIALHALQMVRPFLKMSGAQATAWDIVTQLLGGGGTQ